MRTPVRILGRTLAAAALFAGSAYADPVPSCPGPMDPPLRCAKIVTKPVADVAAGTLELNLGFSNFANSNAGDQLTDMHGVGIVLNQASSPGLKLLSADVIADGGYSGPGRLHNGIGQPDFANNWTGALSTDAPDTEATFTGMQAVAAHDCTVAVAQSNALGFPGYDYGEEPLIPMSTVASENGQGHSAYGLHVKIAGVTFPQPGEAGSIISFDWWTLDADGHPLGTSMGRGALNFYVQRADDNSAPPPGGIPGNTGYETPNSITFVTLDSYAAPDNQFRILVEPAVNSMVYPIPPGVVPQEFYDAGIVQAPCYVPTAGGGGPDLGMGGGGGIGGGPGDMGGSSYPGGGGGITRPAATKAGAIGVNKYMCMGTQSDYQAFLARLAAQVHPSESGCALVPGRARSDAGMAVIAFVIAGGFIIRRRGRRIATP